MNKMKKWMMLGLMMSVMAGMQMNVQAAPQNDKNYPAKMAQQPAEQKKKDNEDYATKTVQELDNIIAQNNQTINKRSAKLSKTNAACINLMKQKVNNTNADFIKGVNAYTETMKSYTDKIRKQKNTCNGKNKKLQKARNKNKPVKQLQSKYIVSQNKLIKMLKQANNKSKEFMEFVKTR